jgi:RimJ/RimL family protein N-acetyltransferase
MERPVINIEGERVAIGPLRRDLVPLYHRWRNDFTSARTLDYEPAPVTLEARIAWYERTSDETSSIRFTVYERASWRPIGQAAWHHVDHRHGTAELGLIIGEPEDRGRGFGTEATRLLIDYAFTALGLHNLMLRVYEYNPAGLRAYEKAGFREFGRRREALAHAGRRWDEIFMQCLATDFESPVLAAILGPD